MGHEFSWLKSIDRLVCLTEFQRSLMTRAGFPEDLLTVKPNFVYYPGPRRLKPSESNQVLFVGRLSEEKGVKLLVEAWNTADPEWGNLVIIGDGPLRTELEAISGDSVTFHGWRPRAEIIDLMLESRALFLPSLWYEGLPLVLLEALSAGLPVVASSLGVSGSLISGISNTLVVETDRDEWVRAVDNLGSRSDLDSIGRSMSQSYQSTFNPTKQLEMLEELYGSVIAEFRG
jgi:glycosyltransferase involved in cell wall biosynthesis